MESLINQDILERNRKLEECKTNHVLHVLLCIFTGGFWLAVWLLVAIHNDSKRKKIVKEYDAKKQYTWAPQLDATPRKHNQWSK